MVVYGDVGKPIDAVDGLLSEQPQSMNDDSLTNVINLLSIKVQEIE